MITRVIFNYSRNTEDNNFPLTFVIKSTPSIRDKIHVRGGKHIIIDCNLKNFSNHPAQSQSLRLGPKESDYFLFFF